MRFVPTTCVYCGAGCGMLLVVKNGRVVGTEGWARNPVNRGKLCIKGRRAYEFVHHPERLAKPLLRVNGQEQEASWDQAYDFVREKLQDIIAKHGPGAVGFLSSAKCTNEENYLLQKFARVLGTPHVDHCARL